MYTKEECFKLGNIARLHSFKGEVSIFLDVEDPEEFNELESVFIEYDNKLVPFFINRIQIRNKGFAVVKFDGVDTEKKALMFLKCPLYLPLEMLPELEGDNYYDFEIKGFKVIDSNCGDIGTVNGVLDSKVNPLVEIKNGDKEILLPKMDQFIDQIDWDNDTLYVTAPDGLIDLYLGGEEEE
jgi:16S rRNA processing protein RimM